MVPSRADAGEPVNRFTESAPSVRRPHRAGGPGAGSFALYNRRVQTTL